MFYDVFSDLCRKKGVSPSFVVQEIGLSKPNAVYWKKGSIPKGDTLQKLADYFGVSVDYLLGKTDFPFPDMTGKTERYEPWTQTDEEIFKRIAGLPEADKQLVLAMIARLKQTGEESGAVMTSKGPYYFYNSQDEAQGRPQGASPAPEGSDTTPPPGGSEGPQEGSQG